MPSSTTKQAKTMSAIAHGWKPTGKAADIPVKVAKEFHAADAGHKYGKGHDMKHEKHHGEGHNIIERGYGTGPHHDGKTDHGQSIAGGKGGKHAHDKDMQSIAGGKGSSDGTSKHIGDKERGEKGRLTEKGGHEGESRGLRSKDSPRSDDRQPHGRRTGEDTHRQVEDRGMEHHIAGGEHGHHEHGSGKAEHHPEPRGETHRFRGGRVEGAHGFGHSVAHRDGHHRNSGHPHAHRIGKK